MTIAFLGFSYLTNCDFYEFCFENARDKKIAVYLNDDHMVTIIPWDVRCLEVDSGKNNVRIEKNLLIVLRRVLVDEWVEVGGSDFETYWIVN